MELVGRLENDDRQKASRCVNVKSIIVGELTILMFLMFFFKHP